ncbi:MAG: hypothetical protein RL754_589 [Bacteroidota bacterium]|jgi:outer membrane protein assembly factor BamA
MLGQSSCSGLRSASESAPLLVENDIRINGKKSTSDEDHDIMRQRPNKRFLGQRFFLSAYNFGMYLGPNFLGTWLQDIGERPVYANAAEQAKTAEQLGLHYFNLGYYRNEITFYQSQKGKKATAHYEVHTGLQYKLGDYQMYATSYFIDSALNHLESTLLPGDPLIAENIEAEQLYITNFLKNNGYYNAQLDWIYFELDTTASTEEASLLCVVDPFIFGGNDERKTIDRIRVEPTFSYSRTTQITDSTRTVHGLDILQGPRKFRPNFLDQQIFLERGQFYSNKDLQQTYKHLTRMGVFANVELNLEESDTGLVANLRLVPMSKRAVTAGIEGLGNSGNVGIGGNFTWSNRNLFGGGELLNISLNGAVTEQRNSTNASWLVDAREVGTSAQLDIPQFLLPQSWIGPKARRWQPHTNISAQTSFQFRAEEFNRTLRSTAIEYRWKTNKGNHLLTPWRLSYVSLNFANDSTNENFLFVGFQNIVFPSTGYTFTRSWKHRKQRYYLGMSLESGGHLWKVAGIDSIQSVPISSYIHSNIDLRLFQSLPHHRELAARTFVGYAQAWGGTGGFVPFEKSFFMGGSNDLRGWTAYHFGPGATSEELLQSSGYFAAAPIKFIQSLEWRFTVQDALKGALFLDAGNMWLHPGTYTGDLSDQQKAAVDAGIFKWNQFYQQLGVNIGYGLRYDVEFFILRADLGLKIHHPGADGRPNWVINNPRNSDLNLSLGIGYPF